MIRMMFGFDGRIGRLDYFLRWLLLVGATMLAAFAVALAGSLSSPQGAPAGGIGSALMTFGYVAIVVAMLWSALGLAVRRGHDIGWPAWATLFPVLGLPVLGFLLPAAEAQGAAAGAGSGAPLGLILSLAPTIVLTAVPGRRSPNAFGPPVREPDTARQREHRPLAG